MYVSNKAHLVLFFTYIINVEILEDWRNKMYRHLEFYEKELVRFGSLAVWDMLTKMVSESCLLENSKKGSPFLLSKPTYQGPSLRESPFLHIFAQFPLYRKLPLVKKKIRIQK